MTLQSDVACLIEEEGKDGTLRRVTEGAYDASAGTLAKTTTDTPIKLMLLNYSDFQRQNELIETGDRKALIKAQGLASRPDNQDLIITGGEELRVIRTRQIEQSGEDVVYICQVRI